MHERFIRAALASAVVVFSVTVVLAQHAATTIPAPQTTWESCDEMHDMYVERFARTPGFGVSRMGQPPMLDRTGVLDLGRARYSIERLELIGALRPDGPVAYLVGAMGPDGTMTVATEFHGRSGSLGSVKSRALSSFEKTSLAAFQDGKDIASARAPSGGLQCIGSLRAKETCVSCHRSKRAGDLLGAFTYELRSLPRQP
jgi:hypothetical protein